MDRNARKAAALKNASISIRPAKTAAPILSTKGEMIALISAKLPIGNRL